MTLHLLRVVLHFASPHSEQCKGLPTRDEDKAAVDPEHTHRNYVRTYHETGPTLGTCCHPSHGGSEHKSQPHAITFLLEMMQF